MRMRTLVGIATFTTLVPFGVPLAGCGGDDEKDTAPPVTTTPEGGTVKDPSSPALNAGDCPQTPVIKGLVKSSPVWGGVVVLKVQVPGGIPDTVEVQLLDPSSNGWGGGAGGERKQEPDGTYVLAVTVRPLQGGEDKPFKLRARAGLQGCPRTAWVESDTFTVGNPFADTTWTSETPIAGASSNIGVAPRGAAKGAGPYTLTAGTTVYHSFTFVKGGTTTETYKFSVASKTADDVYNGCAFQISYVGTWQIKLLGNRMTLFIGERTPKPNPAEGSTCATPTLAQLDITKNSASYRLPATNTDLSYGIDYVSAALAEGQPILWQYNAPFSAQNTLSAVISSLSFTEGPDGASINGSINGVDPYIRK